VEALCRQTSFSNNLTWTNPARDSRNQNCDPNLVSYNIYYGRYEASPLVRVGSSTSPSFRHESLTTVAGCYYVTAVNRRGSESLPSNKVCGDVCPQFLLPNVFTPNGDGKNEVFTPTGCSLFVASVETVIYNRYGGKVYETRDPLINWDGRSSSGQVLPSALYYYEVRVVLAGLDPNAPPLILKGWVQLFRENGVNGG
jgi:gliding motility-associated-like protein